MKKRIGFFTEKYQKCREFLREIKNYIYISIAVFLAFFLIGFFYPVFLREEIFNFIKELMMRFEGRGFAGTFWLIFSNNFQAGFFAIILGIGFGIFPVAATVANGYLLGFVSNYAVSERGIFILWRLLPHGLFELPAIILSISVGLKIGIDFFRKNRIKILRENLGKALLFFVFIVIPLLVIAALIESLLIFYLG